MRNTVLALMALCCWQGHGFCQQAPAPKVGDVVFEATFEGADALKGWGSTPKLDAGFESAQALFIERPAGPASGAAMAQFTLPVEKMRGCLVHFSARVKAENVSEKPKGWNGVKFMTPFVVNDAISHPQATIGTGTFDWKEVVFPVRVPPEATKITLMLGLEAVTGKVWFDNVKATIRKPPLVIAPRVRTGPVYRGHNLPRLRGTMVSYNIDAESLRVLGQEWNANIIRWQFAGWQPKGNQLDLAAYDAWLDAHIKRLDATLPECERNGLMVLLDLHGAPGGSEASGKRLFNDPTCQAKFIEVWQRLARHYKGARAIWGYDLLNEPIENAVAENVADWSELADRAARAVRAIDPDRPIIVEPAQGGGPAGFHELRPVSVDNVVYSVHMYLPHAFTHQGVHGQWPRQFRYPGEVDGARWDRAQLEKALKPVRDFQQKHGVHILVGEFSAIRWVPDDSAYRYLKDLTDIFEDYGWDWIYHAFREWSGWSVEHGTDKDVTARAEQPTNRQELLCGWFAKNRKPDWYRRE